MENLPWSLSLFLAFFTPLVLLLALKFRETRGKADQPRLPPGPWRLPVIGSLHHLVRNPLKHRALADLARRHNAPVMYLRLGELHAVVVSSPAAAREVMKTHDAAFAARPLSLAVRATVADGMGLAFCPYGERWRQLRKLCTQELLSAPRVRTFRPIREEEAACLERKDDAAAEDCLLGVLLGKQNEGGGLDWSLDMGSIKAVILNLFIAGTESTSTIILWAMAELMRNPNMMQKAQAELHCVLQGKSRVTEDDLASIHYLKLIIKETFRLHIPGPLLLPRECRESCKLLGYDIPKGAMVLVNAWAIGRDPKYWDEPDVFKHERFEGAAKSDFQGTDFRYILFGAGRRMCPGQGFSLAMVELVLATLLFHFDWQLPPRVVPSELDMAEDISIVASRKEDLCLHPTIRVPRHGTTQFYLKLIIKETLRLHTPGPLLLPRECQGSCKVLGYEVPKGTMVLANAYAINRDPKIRQGIGFALAMVELVLATLLFHFDWYLPLGMLPNELDMTEEISLQPTIRVPLHDTTQV
nr:unnamed protein product [Digitaria exilis]